MSLVVRGSGGSWGSYQLSVISYQLSVISYQLSVISYQEQGKLGKMMELTQNSTLPVHCSLFTVHCSLFPVPYDTPSVLPSVLLSEAEVSRGKSRCSLTHDK